MTKKSKAERYQYDPHSFVFDKHCGKMVCCKCGLIGLRNKATRWCIEKGCGYKNHEQYSSEMHRLTKIFNF